MPVSYTTSTFEEFFVALLPGGRLGRRCPASRDAVRGRAIDVIGADGVFAQGGQQVRISAPRAGDYLACFWIQRTASDGRGAVAVGDVIRVLPRGRAVVARCVDLDPQSAAFVLDDLYGLAAPGPEDIQGNETVCWR